MDTFSEEKAPDNTWWSTAYGGKDYKLKNFPWVLEGTLFLCYGIQNWRNGWATWVCPFSKQTDMRTAESSTNIKMTWSGCSARMMFFPSVYLCLEPSCTNQITQVLLHLQVCHNGGIFIIRTRSSPTSISLKASKANWNCFHFWNVDEKLLLLQRPWTAAARSWRCSSQSDSDALAFI